MKKFKIISLVTILVGCLGFLSFDTADNYFEISKNLEIYTSIYKELNTYYVDEIEPSKLMKTGIDAMLKSLDPYTNYISESDIEDYRFMTTGLYGGVGAQILTRDKTIFVREVYEGWPAAKADIRAGDEIMEIDNKTTKAKNSDDISKMLKGQPGTEITVLIRRQGVAEPMLKTVKREEIKVKNVPYYGMIDNDHGYIKFTGFRQEAATEVKDALLELKKSHPNLKGIVFDLRGNPGGLLDEAIKTVNIFTSRGQLVVSTKGKMPDWNKEYYTEGQAYDVTTPIVVLTDNGSASAAEIVSGSLQDLDRAVVVGANSFGKGLVQTTRPLPYNAQMKVTTSKYYIPSGRCIQALDYSNKDAEGRPVKTPDSLKKAFKTKNGRTVYSGNGIKPDVALPRDSFPEIVNTLYEKYIIFDFASLYRSKHQNIPPSYLFKLSDADWQEFLEFIKNKEIKYSTETEDILKQLEKTSKAEKYYAAIKTEYDAMIQKLHVDKKADIEKFKPVVIEALEEEIASRYYFLKGRIETRFDDDKDVQEAIRLFKNPEEYKKILSASK